MITIQEIIENVSVQVQENSENILVTVEEVIENVSITISEIGIQGTPGLSAYLIALNQGFIGTEQDWIDSLKIISQNTKIDGGFIF
jgi:hypothetical protein